MISFIYYLMLSTFLIIRYTKHRDYSVLGFFMPIKSLISYKLSCKLTLIHILIRQYTGERVKFILIIRLIGTRIYLYKDISL